MEFLAYIYIMLGLFNFKIELAKTNSVGYKTKIVDNRPCEFLKTKCSRLPTFDDFLILECIQADPSITIDDECQHIIWNHTCDILDNEYVEQILSTVCESDFQNFNCKGNNMPGSFLKCIATNREDIDSKECISLVSRLENVVFDDYHWVSGFLNECGKAINNFGCGRLNSNSSSQANTIICLQDHFSQIEGECRKELVKLTEIQADNIKLDRQLYLSCAEEQMLYCKQYPPGSGKVFKCLMQHYKEHLTDKCRNHLLRRQRMIAEDYRISKGLMRACRDDIKKAHCRRQTSDDKSIRLAQVLLCLENVMKNGTRIDSECENEMRDHRKILMEDYRVSPEIVDGCSNDIKRFCNDLEVGGKTLHCLMEHARGKNSKKRIKDTCMRAASIFYISLFNTNFCISYGHYCCLIKYNGTWLVQVCFQVFSFFTYIIK